VIVNATEQQLNSRTNDERTNERTSTHLLIHQVVAATSREFILRDRERKSVTPPPPTACRAVNSRQRPDDLSEESSPSRVDVSTNSYVPGSVNNILVLLPDWHDRPERSSEGRSKIRAPHVPTCNPRVRRAPSFKNLIVVIIGSDNVRRRRRGGSRFSICHR